MSINHQKAASSLAIVGWMIACVAIAGIVSLWFAVKQGLAPEPYRTSEAWVIGRAVLYGLPFSLLPIIAYISLMRKTRSVPLSS